MVVLKELERGTRLFIPSESICDKPCVKVKQIIYAQNKDGTSYFYPEYYKRQCTFLKRFCGYDLEPCMLCEKYMKDSYSPLPPPFYLKDMGDKIVK